MASKPTLGECAVMGRVRGCGWIGTLLIAAVMAACGHGTTKRPREAEPDSAWRHIVQAHTTGIVSRRATIRVLFAGDVASADGIGKSAAGSIEIRPAIPADIRFAGQREVLISPTRELTAGETYRIRVLPRGLSGVPRSIGPFEFAVTVQRPELDVEIHGLNPVPDIHGVMVLHGRLVTSDVERPERVEKLLTAKYQGRSLAIVWRHDPDERHHGFSVPGIERQDGERSVELEWDGASIGARSHGRRKLAVPPRDEFAVTEVVPIEADGRRQVSVRFSDLLDARQDLRGLVELSTGAFTSRIEANAVVLFPEHAADGPAVVTIQPGIRSARGDRIASASRHPITFASTRPQVRFVGRGVILPASPKLSVPFEAVNVRAVHVTAFEIYEKNIAQFLQVNKLDGARELGRVGRRLWRKKLTLTAPEPGRWNRYSLDMTELFEKHPNALFQLSLAITKADSTYECPGAVAQPAGDAQPVPPDQEDDAQSEASNWDYAEEYFGVEDGSSWADREDPCKDAYYLYADGVKQARNFLASNIGLIAKLDQHGTLFLAATDLRTSRPLDGVKLSVRNFQNRGIGEATTNAAGLARITPDGTPFTVVAEKDSERGYLKVNAGNALPMSHFDVGGEKVAKGLKGFIYGERGVWRPGDTIHLTFVLQDVEKRLPPDHPVTMELYNPRGQRVQSVTNAAPVEGFYAFALRTEADAPTGEWTAKALLGGATFTKSLKIETVMPNRLKVELRFGEAVWRAGEPLRATLAGEWLTGAVADSLDADVSLRFRSTRTRFDRFADFTFDDPARELDAQPETIFTGKLDRHGRAAFEKTVAPSSPPPGMLTALFTSRIFERGGAFSINRASTSLAPYERFIGIKLPKGDVARGMLLTDVPHVVEITSLSADGQLVSVGEVQVTLYQIQWKWWWDQSGDALAQYAQASHSSVVQQSTVSTKDGRGTWTFTVKYPQWGRYLVRACDVKGGHCTGQTLYIDWPSWAGRPQEQSGPAASALTLTTDKEQYAVGDTATVQLPEATQGRALVTVESGTGILEARWLVLSPRQTRFAVPITREMSPNVYVSVTVVQPHENKDNDRPIRLYGVVPIKVSDPATHLKPVIRAANEWKPESIATIEVAEATGRAMAYTLAVVDEGLLGLTSFKTPDPHRHFYKRESLGVTTWDLFDDVVGAYGAQLERLLALGGSDQQETGNPEERPSRFPPVVQVLGPFRIEAGATGRHEIQLPRYVGAVRVMVVAGHSGAYGSAEKSVFVRQALMVLPTLPRVIGPGEEAAVPVSIFAADESIRSVTLEAQALSPLELVGERRVTVAFERPGDKVGVLRIKAAGRIGQGRIRFTATSGPHRAQAEVFLDVRAPNPATLQAYGKTLMPGERWQTKIVPHGLEGTNVTTLEVSAVPPMGLERRLDYLVSYPYGCLEQTTSSVFPQLYLPALVKLEEARRQRIEANVRAGIRRLRGFQQPNGAFTYWPGGFIAPANDPRGAWATTYAGHFLLEAEKLGYGVPADMLQAWIRHQRAAARSWTADGRTPPLDQAYRLYTLALANQADVGAMNRLRETAGLPPAARWLLAAAYRLAGMKDAADHLVRGERPSFRNGSGSDEIFGSELRDAAIVLHSAVTLGRIDPAKPLFDEIAARLSADHWHSTQSVAYALMALSRYVGAGPPGSYRFVREVSGEAVTIESSQPVYSDVLSAIPRSGAPIAVENTSGRTLFVTIFNRGIPAAGGDDASSSGFALDVSYVDAQGRPVDVERLVQGTDLVAEISVRNLTEHRIDNIALAHMVPAGWEIANERLEGSAMTGAREAGVRPTGFIVPDGSPEATTARAEYVDIRDDRIYRHFSLKAGESILFRTRVNAAYRGHYYLPSISVEAMYDATKLARTRGQWIDIVPAER